MGGPQLACRTCLHLSGASRRNDRAPMPSSFHGVSLARTDGSNSLSACGWDSLPRRPPWETAPSGSHAPQRWSGSTCTGPCYWGASLTSAAPILGSDVPFATVLPGWLMAGSQSWRRGASPRRSVAVPLQAAPMRLMRSWWQSTTTSCKRDSGTRRRSAPAARQRAALSWSGSARAASTLGTHRGGGRRGGRD